MNKNIMFFVGRMNKRDTDNKNKNIRMIAKNQNTIIKKMLSQVALIKLKQIFN